MGVGVEVGVWVGAGVRLGAEVLVGVGGAVASGAGKGDMGVGGGTEVGVRGVDDPTGRWDPVLGPHGNTRRSRMAQPVLEWCVENELAVAESYHPQRVCLHKSTLILYDKPCK